MRTSISSQKGDKRQPETGKVESQLHAGNWHVVLPSNGGKSYNSLGGDRSWQKEVSGFRGKTLSMPHGTRQLTRNRNELNMEG